MRLLHAETLEFKDFTGAEAAPKYAILSHTWGNDEVTYEDMRASRGTVESKSGFEKIKFCAWQTTEDSLEYFWIDTCCIDKSSSAELSEAINSMFQWYQKSAVCYAYLSDVTSVCRRNNVLHETWCEWVSKLKTAKWFTRGWTLQELIAPRQVVFYTSMWEQIGTRETLAWHIQDRTRIPSQVLVAPQTALLETSVAQRMSWAARRETHRPEDRAYCLMGLFDVNMPMLYGEGEKAFIRLQEEIIKTSDDMSIFAWTDPNGAYSSYRGLLAKSPAEFRSCTELRCTPQSTIPPYRTTNKGIELSVQLDPREEGRNESIAWLHGVVDAEGPVGIHIKEVGRKQYARVDPGTRVPIRHEDRGSTGLKTFFVRQQIFIEDGDLSRASGITLHDEGKTVLQVRPDRSWDRTTDFIHLHPQLAPTVVVILSLPLTQETYTMEFDIRKTWKDFLSGDKSWDTTQIQDSPSQMKLICKRAVRSPMGRMHVGILVRRGVFDGEFRLLMGIKATVVKAAGNYI